MKKVAVIGHFGFGRECFDGQTIKTKTFTNEICRQLGDEEVLKIDTHGTAKTLLKAPFMTVRALKNSENVVIFPAHNGLRVFASLLSFFNRFFHRKLRYVVIGGWLSDFLKSKKRLRKKLKKFDGIYVETSTMKKALEEQGFNNVSIVPNCKNLKVLDESELVYNTPEPYKLCTFSRVMKEKGIEDAVNAVKSVNETFGRTVCTLDIYGQVDANQIQWFDDLKNTFPDYVKYIGAVAPDKSVEVLKNYFALLFTTRFYTEGIPGTIIDAYCAGIPVISAKWESFSDVVEDGVTGIGYSFNNRDELIRLMTEFIKVPDKLNAMKKECISKASDFSLQRVISDFVKGL